MNDHAVHVADPFREHFHHVHGEEWILLNDAMEAWFINFCEARRLAGNHSRTALGAVNESHFTNDAASARAFDDPIANHHVQSAFENDIHGIGRIAGFEKEFARRQSHRVGLVRKQLCRVHRDESKLQLRDNKLQFCVKPEDSTLRTKRKHLDRLAVQGGSETGIGNKLSF